MNQDNPLLQCMPLPAFPRIRPEHVMPAIAAILGDFRQATAAMLAPGAPRSFAGLLLAQQRLEQRLANAWAPVSHLHAVADSAAWREVYAPAEALLAEHAVELGQNRELYAAVQGLAEAADFAG